MKIKEKHTAFEAKLSSDEELLQTLLTGLSSKGAKNQGGGYMGALADARARIAQGAAEEQQSKVKLGMSEKELAELEQRNRAFAKEAEASMKKIANLKAAVQAIEAKIANCGWSQEKDQDLERQLRNAREELKNLTEVCFCMISLIFEFIYLVPQQRDRFKSRIGRLSFDYEDPTPNFDRRRVKGVAAQLISLPKEHSNKATALEIAGGGKLFNVVVEDDQVGKNLIKNGRMKKRVTFIPLNRISSYTLSEQVRYFQTLHSIHKNISIFLNHPETQNRQLPCPRQSPHRAFPGRVRGGCEKGHRLHLQRHSRLRRRGHCQASYISQ